MTSVLPYKRGANAQPGDRIETTWPRAIMNLGTQSTRVVADPYPKRIAHDEEEASSTDSTYHIDVDRVGWKPASEIGKGKSVEWLGT